MKIRERTALKPLPEWVQELPWQYGGQFKSRSIVLDATLLTPEQKDRLQKEVPDIHFNRYDDLFNLQAFKPEQICGYITRMVMDAPHYQRLQPIADSHLSGLIKQIATFPWRVSDVGAYEIHQRELRKEQQQLIQQLPEDFYDRKAERSKIIPYSELKTFVLDPKAPDQRLLHLIRQQSNQALLATKKQHPAVGL
ncbi:MAG: hypothetical protein ACOYK8_09790 [Alphaproteobacteria bacterium]